MARNYGTAVRSFLCFYGRKDICFHEITPSLMQDYEKWLKSRVGMSTVSCYFRSLRALYNKAVERELCRQKFPFARVYTGYPKTEKRSITVSEVRKLQALKLEAGSFVELARNLFIMSVLLCGMPFVDLAFLKKSQIKITYSLTTVIKPIIRCVFIWNLVCMPFSIAMQNLPPLIMSFR